MRVTYHAPGERATDLKLGDFILSRAETDQGKLIRFGQKLRYGNTPGVEVNHAALCFGDGILVEALNSGVRASKLSWYNDSYYAAVRIEASTHDRLQIRKFANSVVQAKTGYGKLHIASITLSILIPRLFFGVSGTEICSGFVAEAMTRAGWIWDSPPGFTSPLEIADQCGVDLPWFDGV